MPNRDGAVSFFQLTREMTFILLIFHVLFLKKIVFVYFCLCQVFVAACTFSLVALSRGDSLVVERGLLIAMASLVVEHGL